MAKRSTGRQLNMLGVKEIIAGIGAGEFTARDVVEDCLARIDERNGSLHAWVGFDRELALRQTNDRSNAAGPLAGVPFGVKDVIDTAAFATQMGSRLYMGNRTPYDAGCVGLLRLAGGIVLGKTVTCEFAGTQPADTVNPHDHSRTPGGSSSGSAAAVADFMVPLALGTQTGGSVLRPAAFCGVVGFKPTFGLYPISGMKPAAHSFDTPGLFTRSVEDAALVHSVLMNDAETQPAGAPPRIGVLRIHLRDTVDRSAGESFDRTLDVLGGKGAAILDISPPEGFERITEKRAVINAFERARNFAGECLAAREDMGPLTREISERGFHISGSDYAAARHDVERFRMSAAAMFEGVDVIVTPATPGEAPAGLQSTGDPRLQELWTMLHMPSMSLPCGRGPEGLPLGLQIVGRRFDDRNLLARALWMESGLRDSEQERPHPAGPSRHKPA